MQFKITFKQFLRQNCRQEYFCTFGKAGKVGKSRKKMFSFQETGSGFAWSNLLTTIMQIFLPQNTGSVNPSKNDIDEATNQSPWTNLLTVGLRVLTAFLTGNQQTSDGIDKVDTGSTNSYQVQFPTAFPALFQAKMKIRDDVCFPIKRFFQLFEQFWDDMNDFDFLSCNCCYLSYLIVCWKLFELCHDSIH